MTRPRPIADGKNDGPRPADGSLAAALGLGLSRYLLQTLASVTREIVNRPSGQAELGAGPAEPGAPAIAIALCTLEGRFLEVNDTLVSLSGYTRDEVVGRTGNELGLWTDLQELLCSLRLRGTVDGYLLSYRTRAGQKRRMLLAAQLLTVKGRGCVLAVGADVKGLIDVDEAAF